MSPTGTIRRASAPAARAPRAMRAAPVRNGNSFSVSLTVPSGKMPITPSTASSASQASNELWLSPPPPSWRRWTGSTPANPSSGPTAGTLHNVDLARKRTGRGDDAMSSTGSTNPLAWLAHTRMGRSRVIWSIPSTSTDRNHAFTITRPRACTARSAELRRVDALVATAGSVVPGSDAPPGPAGRPIDPVATGPGAPGRTRWWPGSRRGCGSRGSPRGPSRRPGRRRRR